ncbi:nitrous oxide reductase accessory protein NosL [Paenibacillus sp. strain BS8-2]
MRKQWSWMGVILVLTLVLTACGEKQYEAQAINEETDICVICKMAIKDDQYATQIVTKDGQSLKFDDIGCLNTWKTENGTDTIGAAFVRDFNSKQWLPYDKAYYAYDPTYQTPMAYGIVSFEKEEDAKSFIAEKGTGTLMTSADLTNHTWAVNMDMMNMDGHEHEHEGTEGHDSKDQATSSGGHAS